MVAEEGKVERGKEEREEEAAVAEEDDCAEDDAEVPVITGKLPDDLRRYLLAALPSEECTVLEQYGFEPCCDHPGLQHRYAEGYFHALSGAVHRHEPSVHPRYPSEVKLQRRPAPLRLAAFCEAFREKNASCLEELVDALDDACSALSVPFARGAHFADVSMQLNWGEAVPPDYAAWHTDAAYSLMHLALGLQGERTLLARRQLRSSAPVPMEEAELAASEDFESLPQAEGAVYLSAPCLFPHAVQYPEASWEQRVVSVQCRFLFRPEDLADVKAELAQGGFLERAVLQHLHRGALHLPSLQEVRAVEARLASEEKSLEQELLKEAPSFTKLYGQLERGGSAMHAAAGRGHSGVVRRILDHRKFRARNAKDEDGHTALHIAVHEGCREAVRLLADDARFSEVNAKSAIGHTALHVAALMGHLDVFQLLIDHERFFAHDKKCSVGGTALHVAAEMGRCKIMEILLGNSRFSEVDAKNKEGNTALHIAAGMGEVDALRILLGHQRFTLVEAGNQTGGTALHVAASMGRLETAAALLDHSGFQSVNTQDKYGNTALHSAAGVGAADVVRLLLEHSRFQGHDARNSAGGTALHVAARMCQLEAMVMLLEHPRFELVNAQNYDGNTALHFAAKRGHFEGVQVLLDNVRFTDVEVTNQEGKTALHLSMSHGHPELYKVFCERQELGEADAPHRGEVVHPSEQQIPVPCW